MCKNKRPAPGPIVEVTLEDVDVAKFTQENNKTTKEGTMSFFVEGWKGEIIKDTGKE